MPKVDTPVPPTTMECLGRDKMFDEPTEGEVERSYSSASIATRTTPVLRMSCADATVPFLRFVEVQPAKQLRNLDSFLLISCVLLEDQWLVNRCDQW